MRKANRRRSERAAFTLVEMLVTLLMLSVLASITGVICLKARSRSRVLTCLDHQRQISTALLAHFQDRQQFPDDGPNADLAMALKDYIPWQQSMRQVKLPGVYRCLNDAAGPLSNSYEPFYVRRRELAVGDYFVLGCPRHEDAESAYLNMLGARSGVRSSSGTIVVNDQIVKSDTPASSRTINWGRVDFEDTSSAKVTRTSGDYELTAVASFRQEDGRLYTIVRVNGDGKADFKVKPGSKFEVVTPVAIIGVRGTQFTVRSEGGYTRVDVQSGVVHVWDRLKNETHLLEKTEYVEIGEPAAKRLRLTPASSSGYRWRVCNPNDFAVSFKWRTLDDDDDVSEADYSSYLSGFSCVTPTGSRILQLQKKCDALQIFYVLPGLGELTEAVDRRGASVETTTDTSPTQ